MGDKFGVKEVMNVTLYDLENDQPKLHLDTLKLSSLENLAEQAQARGGHGNPILLTWDYNREANFEIQDALVSARSLSILAGTDLQTGTTTVYKREVKTVSGDLDVEVSEDPADEDKVFVYLLDDDGGDPLSITITNKVIDLDYGGQVTAGDRVAVYYTYETDIESQTITITSEDFPGYYKMVGDTVVRNARTGRDEKFQLIVERAKVMPGFTMSMEAEGDPSVFDMNIQAYKPVDGTEMVKMIKY